VKSINSYDPEEGIQLCDHILDLLDELPEAAEEFADSVKAKVIDIHDWIEAKNHITDSQYHALERMLAGVEKWLH
jgi:hypothetical protein